MVAGEKRIPVRNSPIKIRKAVPADMPFIREHIESFRLDDEDMDYHQFVVSAEADTVVGFGRIRLHGEVFELGSLGVIERKRNRGVGKMIVEHIIEIFPADEVYVTTDIPGYFERLGFVRVARGPEDLIKKTRGVCRTKGSMNPSIMRYDKRTVPEKAQPLQSISEYFRSTHDVHREKAYDSQMQ